MKTNPKTIRSTKGLKGVKQKLYYLKNTSNESKAIPTAKKVTLINKSKSNNEKDKTSLPDINSHRLGSSKNTQVTKIEIEGKEKKKEEVEELLYLIDPLREANDNLQSDKLIELDNELKRLNDANDKIKNKIALNEKTNINLLRDIENRDTYISMKNHKLSKVKKEYLELKSKLEEMNNKSKGEAESLSQSDNNEGESNPIDELSSCQYSRDEEEEANPLSPHILEKIPVISYNTNRHSQTKKCLLCNFELCPNDLILQIPSCQHIFHNACLSHHFQKSNSCPSCKAEVKES